jgi:hypothetical protein
MEAGKLYICEEYFLLLYPDPETATAVGHGVAPAAAVAVVAAAAAGGTAEAAAADTADYWSNRFGKPVLYAKKNIPLLILNNREKYVEVLAGDRKGWIIFNDYLNIKEIVDEAA